MVIDRQFWNGKRVFLTGHTGFKGSWLSLWLSELGAVVTGYALPPPTDPSLFEIARVGELMRHIEGDVRDLAALRLALSQAQPDIVIHMAAQSLVRVSYDQPVETYATNVMGTVHLLEAVRSVPSVRAVLIITSDKCYENQEWEWGYRESEPMGGFDPYSNSKGCAELVVSAYRRSFFSADRRSSHGIAVASARSGNVIGGGDWALDRLIPDMMRAFQAGESPLIRNPGSIRPWQHVLEPLRGYLMLCERLWTGEQLYADGWNFGPVEGDARTVGWIADRIAGLWGNGAGWKQAGGEHPHEAHFLKLDCSKARHHLDWSPVWGLGDALSNIVDWFKAREQGCDMRDITLGQIRNYVADVIRLRDTQAV